MALGREEKKGHKQREGEWTNLNDWRRNKGEKVKGEKGEKKGR